MTHRLASVVQVTILVFALLRTVFGDMGSIPFRPGVRIFEPTQRAMIAWNGRREILILSTDLHASAPTKVLEVMPFPSEPKVKKGKAEIFKQATDLINLRIGSRHYQNIRRMGGETMGGRTAPPPATVTFHEQIGSHNVSVIRMNDPARFAAWVHKYLRSLGVGAPRIPPQLALVIEEYIRDQFSWFVFDVVSLQQKPKTKEAIQFEFDSRWLYYPLRITRAESGDTRIHLIIVTRELLSVYNFDGIPRKQVKLLHKPVPINDGELLLLNEDIFRLLREPQKAELRIWEIRGPLSSFEDDLRVRMQ